MGFKDEIKREIRNAMKDIEKEVNRTWKFDYKGHSIEIINQIKEEMLIIDGQTVDMNKRKYLFSHIIPYSKLSGILELQDGTKQKVTVKLGGYVKFNCIVKVGKETIISESLNLEILPWNHKEKIVPFIHQQIQTHNKIVDDRLPDDEYFYGENAPRLAAGLADYLIETIPDPSYVKKLIKLFEEQIHVPSIKTRKATYEKIISDNIVSYYIEFIEQFQQAQYDEALVQQEAIWLLEHATHREVVKFAITVLGFTDCEKYKERLFTLGMHEEFTLYVMFALKNGTIEANNQIWRLAQEVHGWGKIVAVNQLEARTPEIKQWLLTNGCKNTILNEYLAYTCATNGELDVALYEETISKELYDGAGLIIVALINEREPQGIDDYPYASTVLSRYVHHAHMHCNTLEDFYPIMKISAFLQENQEVWEERFNDSWKQYEFTAIQQAIQPLTKDSKWPQLVIDKLQKEFNYRAFEIARYYQLEVTQQLFDLLEMNPTNSELYLAIMNSNDRQSIIDLCTFAETHLSLSSPSNEEEACLDIIIRGLSEHEGVGLALIQAALTLEHGTLQYFALSVLEEWAPSYSQQANVQELIKNIATTTKDKEDRQLAKHLLKNK